MKASLLLLLLIPLLLPTLLVLPLPLMLRHRLGIRVLLFLLFLDGYRLHRLLADPKKLLLMRAAFAQHS